MTQRQVQPPALPGRERVRSQEVIQATLVKDTRRRSRWWVWALLGLGMLFMVLLVVSTPTGPDVTPDSPEAAPWRNAHQELIKLYRFEYMDTKPITIRDCTYIVDDREGKVYIKLILICRSSMDQPVQVTLYGVVGMDGKNCRILKIMRSPMIDLSQPSGCQSKGAYYG